MASLIASLYTELLRRARKKGLAQVDLQGGARMYVRFEAGVITVSFARQGKKLGDTELTTFHHHCDIPVDAERLPPEGQALRNGWYVRGYRWRE
jgi:hypothetical protein